MRHAARQFPAWLIFDVSQRKSVSNASIVAHIEEELAAFERNERTVDQMEKVLAAHFEALEGISYSTLQELRDFEYLLVRSQFADEDSRFESREVVLEKLRHALHAIKQTG